MNTLYKNATNLNDLVECNPFYYDRTLKEQRLLDNKENKNGPTLPNLKVVTTIRFYIKDLIDFELTIGLLDFSFRILLIIWK